MPEGKVELDKKVDPILLRKFELSIEEWKDKLDPRATDDKSIPYDDDSKKINPLRQALIDQMDLRQGNPKEDPLYKALASPGDPNYVYRCIARNGSDESPIDNIHKYGTDKPPEEDDWFMYSVGSAWFLKLSPKEGPGAASYIIIYKNNPNVFPPGKDSLWLKNQDNNKPSLRDQLIGVVELDWKWSY